MTPRIARRGHSFIGAGNYYLHDKQAQTTERVAWSSTINLATNDPTKAMRHMAYTAMQADRLKQQQGSSSAGRKACGPVYAFSLSWHPQQQPSREEMQTAAHATIERLGLQQHEAVMVAHSDTDHAHVHIIANLVHPDTGKIADIRLDQRKLSAWALEYEREHGHIYCEQREINAQRLKEGGQIVKYQDEAHAKKAHIQLCYETSHSGAEFIQLLADEGLTVAHGDKGRIVIVDSKGAIQNLTRQLPKGVGKKQLLEKFSDVDVSTLPDALSVSQEHQQAKQAPTPAETSKMPLQAHLAAVSTHMARLEEGECHEQAEAIKEVQRQPQTQPPPSSPQTVQQQRHVAQVARHVAALATWAKERPASLWEQMRSLWNERQQQREKQQERELER